jgi:drug/metabolite transporter (DMT)-like permease
MAPYFAGIGFASIFGLSFLFTKAALESVDFLRLLGFRFAIAALAISLLVVTRVVKLDYRGKDIRPVLLAALFQPISYFIFETNGIMRSTTSQAGMMIALIPIVVAVLSSVFLGERANVKQWGCIFLSVSGVAFVASKNVGTDAGQTGLMGLLFLLGAVLSAAAYNIASRRSSRQFSPLEVTFVMMWMGAIVFNVMSVLKHWQAGTLAGYFSPIGNTQVLMALLYLGVLSSVVAFFFVNYAISRLPVSQAAVFANLVTVVSITAGVVVRGEPFSTASLIGAAMILTGVWGTNYFGLDRVARREGIEPAHGV